MVGGGGRGEKDPLPDLIRRRGKHSTTNWSNRLIFRYFSIGKSREGRGRAGQGRGGQEKAREGFPENGDYEFCMELLRQLNLQKRPPPTAENSSLSNKVQNLPIGKIFYWEGVALYPTTKFYWGGGGTLPPFMGGEDGTLLPCGGRVPPPILKRPLQPLIDRGSKQQTSKSSLGTTETKVLCGRFPSISNKSPSPPPP